MIHWERHGKSSLYVPFVIKASKPTQRHYLGHHYELNYSNNHVTDDQRCLFFGASLVVLLYTTCVLRGALLFFVKFYHFKKKKIAFSLVLGRQFDY